MVFFGIAEMEDMLTKHIDWETIALLFSMMIIVSITGETGVFAYVAIKLSQKVKGKPAALLFIISAMTAGGSAFLDNVTTVLILAPIVFQLTEILRISSIPFLTSMILFSNIGGTATLIGDPPNMMIGQAVDDLGFHDFLLHLGPIALVIYGFTLLLVLLYFRRDLQVSEFNQRRLLAVNAADVLKTGPVLVKSLCILFATCIGFVFHPFFSLDLTAVACAGALLLLILTYEEEGVENALARVEWGTLFFFLGLFMLVGGLREVGIIDEAARGLLYVTEGDVAWTALTILWGSGLLSAFVDNIPFVAAMIPVIFEFREFGMTNLTPFWWALALGACLGGNGTLIGASANVIVAGFAAKNRQPLSFLSYMKIGMTVVLLSLAVSTIYLYFRYLLPFQ